jgi:hypothetical protein
VTDAEFSLWFQPAGLFLTENVVEELALLGREFPGLVFPGGFGFGEEAVEGEHAAVENVELGALFAEAFEFRGLEGGGLAEDPGDDARLDGFVADGVEWGWRFFVHLKRD